MVTNNEKTDVYRPAFSKAQVLVADDPEKSGLDALSEIRAHNRDAFVVMVSAHSSAENVKHAIKLGADGFIVKPYTAKKVEQLIAKYNKT